MLDSAGKGYVMEIPIFYIVKEQIPCHIYGGALYLNSGTGHLGNDRYLRPATPEEIARARAGASIKVQVASHWLTGDEEYALCGQLMVPLVEVGESARDRANAIAQAKDRNVQTPSLGRGLRR